MGTLKELQKLTKTKLVDIAMEHEDIVGAHGMTKDQLIEVIAAKKRETGEWVEEEHEDHVSRKRAHKIVDVLTVRQQIRELKKQRDEAVAAGDHAALVKARAGVHRLKGKLRRSKEAQAH